MIPTNFPSHILVKWSSLPLDVSKRAQDIEYPLFYMVNILKSLDMLRTKWLDIIPDSNKLIKNIAPVLSIKNCEGSRILPTRKWISYIATFHGCLKKTWNSLAETKDFITHGTARNMSISIPVSLPSVPSPTKDDADRPQRNEWAQSGLCISYCIILYTVL